MKIKISKEIETPNQTVTQKLAWLGTTGSGKTYGASKLAEQFWYIGAQFVVIDPVGVWYGLRLAKDGKKPSDITIPIFGGLHGDVPLESTAGALLANLVVDKNLSCVIDVSQFESDAEKARFAADFADRLFFRKKAAPSAMHLFLEECQEFVPQNPQRGEERMLHAFTRMQKLGRNFGIGSSYISQRPQEVNKKALNMAQTLFVFRITGTHERTAVEKWIEDKSLDENLASDLPKLPTGTCHVWSPEFLKVSETTRILEKETFNASATPEVGVAARKRELAPIDLEKVRNEMAATIEKAKADDPKALRAEIARLTKEAKTGKNSPLKSLSNEKTAEIVEKAVKNALLARDREWKSKLDGANREIQRLGGVIVKVSNILGVERTSPVFTIEQKQPSFSPIIPTLSKPVVQQKIQIETDGETLANLTGPEQKILNAIAWLESIGNQEPEATAVAFLAGYTFGGGGFNNPKGSLRSKSLIEYRGSNLALTDAGRGYARIPDTVLTQEELHTKVLSVLQGPEQRLLRPLLENGGDAMSNEDLASASGYVVGSGGFNNPKGRLRSLGLVDYPQSGYVRAREILFI